jgi:type IV pilus assembly protein PilV
MRSEAGFTLLELLVAISILAVGLLATLNMQSTALGANAFAQRTTVAASVARAAMDEVISRPGSDVFFDTALPAGTPYDLNQQTAAMTQIVQGVTYSATIQVIPGVTVNGTAITNLTGIILTVTGADRTITLSELKRAL